ncbi:MAG: hypothetical protein EZS28_031975, partial [Streblomastix strix]
MSQAQHTRVLALTEERVWHPLSFESEPESDQTGEPKENELLFGGSLDPLSVIEKGNKSKGEYTEEFYLTSKHLSKYAEAEMPSDRFVLRLEKLNNSDEKEQEEVKELSFQEVIELAEQRKNELIEAWKVEERVRSLKIVIQLCKFLMDVTYPYLYPRLFAVVGQVLDMFGEMVFERLCMMAFKTARPGEFSASEVDMKTKDRCQNWLFKVASIRELIPRIYVEASLLHTLKFMEIDSQTQAVERLLKQTNGIGHPLIAAYARAYVVRKGMDVIGKNDQLYKKNLKEYLFQLKNATSENRREEMKSLKIHFGKYLRVYSPSMQIIIASLRQSKQKYDIASLLLQQHKDICSESLLLFHLIEVSPFKNIGMHAVEILQRIKEDSGVIGYFELLKERKEIKKKYESELSEWESDKQKKEKEIENKKKMKERQNM